MSEEDRPRTLSDRVMEENRRVVAKASVLGSDIQDSNTMQGVDELETAFTRAYAIEPPYNPMVLTSLFEMSNSLRQNIDAYATNIDGFGHTFKPIVDLDAPDADARISQAMYSERLIAQQASGNENGVDTTGSLIPNEQEIADRKKQLVEEMRFERARLERFFDFVCDEMSFISLRRRLRQDLEQLGNAYFEVLRDSGGEIVEFVYMPAYTLRLRPMDKERTTYRTRVKTSDFEYEDVEKRKLFRTFVQILEFRTVYFKELGDPRTISRRSGAPVPDGHEFESNDGPATELVHLRIHSSRSSYGVPRWIGNLLSVFGSRQAEEVNHAYFENKSVPPLAVLVSGGQLAKESVKRLESFFDNEVKGKKNFHKVLVIEGVGPDDDGFNDGPGMQMKLDIKPLTDAMNKDALFLNYDEKNIDKVGMSFRLPRMLRGDIRDFNRASAEAALEFAEQQVFAPERSEFDWIINRRIFTEIGVRFWRFESNTPTTKDPGQLSEIISKLSTAGILTPEEGRELAQGVFNKELANLDAAWTKQPLALTLAGVPYEGEEQDEPYTGEESGPGQEHALFGNEEPAAQQGQEKDDLSTGDLRAQGGLNRGGGRKRPMLRVPAPSLTTAAKQLLALRDALFEAESARAQKSFTEQRMRTLRDEAAPVTLDEPFDAVAE